MARPLRQTLFPTPIPTPVPTPTPTPIPNLWNTRFFDRTPALFSPDRKTIYTAGKTGKRSGMISAWDNQTTRLRKSFSIAKGLEPWRQVTHGAALPSLALSDDGKRLAYTWDGQPKQAQVGIYALPEGKRLRMLSNDTAYARPQFLPRTHTLFVGLNGHFEIWDADSGKLRRRVSWHNPIATASWLRSPSFSPDGKQLALVRDAASDGNWGYANGRGDEIGIFSTQTWRRTRVFSWPHTEVRAMGFVNNGQSLILNTTTVRWAKQIGKQCLLSRFDPALAGLEVRP